MLILPTQEHGRTFQFLRCYFLLQSIKFIVIQYKGGKKWKFCAISCRSGKPDCDCMGMKKWQTPRKKGTLTKHLGPSGLWSVWWRVNNRFSAFITHSTRKRAYPVSVVGLCRGAINMQEKEAVLDVFCTQCQHLYSDQRKALPLSWIRSGDFSWT